MIFQGLFNIFDLYFNDIDLFYNNIDHFFREKIVNNFSNNPIQKANLIYTIYEDTSRMSVFLKGKVFWIENLAILKEEVNLEKLEMLWKQSRQ